MSWSLTRGFPGWLRAEREAQAQRPFRRAIFCKPGHPDLLPQSVAHKGWSVFRQKVPGEAWPILPFDESSPVAACNTSRRVIPR